jgi:hypothetical protein
MNIGNCRLLPLLNTKPRDDAMTEGQKHRPKAVSRFGFNSDLWDAEQKDRPKAVSVFAFGCD